MTERAKFTLTVKEHSSGISWIAAEQLSGEMASINGLIGFDLVPGTTLDQATEIAKYLRQHIRGLSLTH
jgi:hypothetical protein